jgi:hypothetical protein
MFKDCTIKNSAGEKVFKLEIADTFLKRFLGLMGRKKIPAGQGLLILPCNSIHMLFMRFSIDAVYVDENFIVKKIVRNLPAWIGMSICSGAHAVIELAVGEADRLNFQIGSKIIF